MRLYLHQLGLDFQRRQLVPATLYDINAGPPQDPIIAILVRQRDGVASPEKAIGVKAVGGGGGPGPVLREDTGAADSQLAAEFIRVGVVDGRWIGRALICGAGVERDDLRSRGEGKSQAELRPKSSPLAV